MLLAALRALRRPLGPPFGEGAVRGWRKLLAPLPAQAWSGRIVIAKPVLVLRSEGQQTTVTAQIVPNPPGFSSVCESATAKVILPGTANPWLGASWRPDLRRGRLKDHQGMGIGGDLV